MPKDGMTYLQELADQLLQVARRAEQQHRATAVQFALAELQGAANALIALGAVEAEPASSFARGVRSREQRALVEAGLATPVQASASASLRLQPALRRREESDSE